VATGGRPLPAFAGHRVVLAVLLNSINQPETQRDPDLSASLRESVLDRIVVPSDDVTTSSESRSVASHAISLAAAIGEEGC
jgi:hypothetical protein